jgi:hypothetical protein
VTDQSDAPLDEGTRAADRNDASTTAHADRMPTGEEERLAEQSAAQVDVDAVAEHYEEMADLGANVEGEGRID